MVNICLLYVISTSFGLSPCKIYFLLNKIYIIFNSFADHGADILNFES